MQICYRVLGIRYRVRKIRYRVLGIRYRVLRNGPGIGYAENRGIGYARKKRYRVRKKRLFPEAGYRVLGAAIGYSGNGYRVRRKA